MGLQVFRNNYKWGTEEEIQFNDYINGYYQKKNDGTATKLDERRLENAIRAKRQLSKLWSELETSDKKHQKVLQQKAKRVMIKAMTGSSMKKARVYKKKKRKRSRLYY